MGLQSRKTPEFKALAYISRILSRHPERLPLLSKAPLAGTVAMPRLPTGTDNRKTSKQICIPHLGLRWDSGGRKAGLSVWWTFSDGQMVSWAAHSWPGMAGP